MPLRQRFDRVLLGAAILQTTVGLAILASASWLIATERYGLPGSYFFSWQAATAIVGLGLMVVAMHLKPAVLSDLRLIRGALFGVVALLAASFFAAPVANTHRWIALGGLSVQPSVLARLVMVALAAVLLAQARQESWRWQTLVELVGALTVVALLIVMAPDLGSAALLVVVILTMAFVAGLPLKYIVTPVSLGLFCLVALIASSPYRLARVRAFVDPTSVSAAAWQSTQSLVALGSGGVLGKGYGAGLQKLFFLPEPHTDFIFAITGEELGLAGVTILMVLAAVIVWRGVRISLAMSCPTRALLAFGLSFAFALQSLIHMAVCLALLPPKGIPLPLVSYGKTDLITTLASIGVLLSLSREVRA